MCRWTCFLYLHRVKKPESDQERSPSEVQNFATGSSRVAKITDLIH